VSADFIVAELARLDGKAGEVRQRLAIVDAELEVLETRPTTPESLAAELLTFDRVWGELVPAEQERLTRLVVERVVVRQDGIDLALRADGVAGLVQEITGGGGTRGRDREEPNLEAAHG